MIATSVCCADWLAFLARYRPLHLERPHQTRRLVPTQTKRAFTAFYLLLHVLATGLQPIDRAHNPSRVTSSPLDLPLFPEKVSETMDCLCARLALCFDDDTRPMFCRSDLPFDGYNERENNGHVLCCSSSCLSFQWFLSGRLAQFDSMLALCEDVSVPF